MLKAGFELLWDSFGEWRADNVGRLGAALAFYTSLSLAPIFTVAVGTASLVFNQQDVRRELTLQIEALIGTSGARVAQILFDNAFSAFSDRPGSLPTVIGVLIFLFVASTVLHELRTALDEIWRTEPSHPRSLTASVLSRLISIASVLGIGFLLVVSLVISAGLSAFTGYLSNRLPSPVIVLSILEIVFSFCVLTVLFAMINKFVPNVKLTWSDVLPGSLLTAFIFVIGKWIIGLMLGRSIIASAYGAAGALVVFLLWVFFSAQMFFFGAEFVKVYARRYGSVQHGIETKEEE